MRTLFILGLVLSLGFSVSGAVSEMPAQKKGLIWALLGSLIVGGLWWLQKKKKKE
ncbi:MAG: LPXTG cell wall anchor domain-containing protein [Proteobacteria bacterium]|nr:LPXTG cell wall anchor domain-containing protein [Pseudomonadota bacterium]